MPHYSTSVLSAGVDTLTCSAERDKNGEHLLQLAKQLMLAEERQGSKLSPFRRAVYAGAQSAHVAWGENRTRVLAELRGRWAYDWWESFTQLADKVSRIDVQVSVRQEPYDHDLALRFWRDDRKKAEQAGRPANFQLIAEAAGGTTLYIGRGASRYQARMYERWYKEQRDENKDVWRYEVQCRRERANQVAALARGSGELQPFVSSLVHRHFSRRGVVPIYDPTLDVGVAPLPEAETDRDKSLRWLSSTAAPALRRHEAWGSYGDALSALGIDRTLEQH